MPETVDETGGDVTIQLELVGRYDDVMRKLREPSSGVGRLEAVTADLSALLSTVVRLGGGTRSAIADELPRDTAVEYDAEAVVEALQVLERYDLVLLEGNTWKPAPDLEGYPDR